MGFAWGRFVTETIEVLSTSGSARTLGIFLLFSLRISQFLGLGLGLEPLSGLDLGRQIKTPSMNLFEGLPTRLPLLVHDDVFQSVLGCLGISSILGYHHVGISLGHFGHQLGRFEILQVLPDQKQPSPVGI